VHPPGLFQLLVIVAIVIVLFGRGKISAFMGDIGNGVKTFRKNLADDDEPVQPVPVDGAVHEAMPSGEAIAEPLTAPDPTHK
jgi:sec-independent protein translocase protein TatA